MTRTMKDVQGDAIHAEGEPEEQEAEGRAPVFGFEYGDDATGYQYHPPKKTFRQKLREIMRILRE